MSKKSTILTVVRNENEYVVTYDSGCVRKFEVGKEPKTLLAYLEKHEVMIDEADAEVNEVEVEAVEEVVEEVEVDEAEAEVDETDEVVGEVDEADKTNEACEVEAQEHEERYEVVVVEKAALPVVKVEDVSVEVEAKEPDPLVSPLALFLGQTVCVVGILVYLLMKYGFKAGRFVVKNAPAVAEKTKTLAVGVGIAMYAVILFTVLLSAKGVMAVCNMAVNGWQMRKELIAEWRTEE